jgi:hypothetical protein
MASGPKEVDLFNILMELEFCNYGPHQVLLTALVLFQVSKYSPTSQHSRPHKSMSLGEPMMSELESDMQHSLPHVGLGHPQTSMLAYMSVHVVLV